MTTRMQGSRRSAIIGVVAVMMLLLSTHAPALGQPVVSVDPTAAAAGSTVRITGSGFERHCPVDLFFDSTEHDPLGSAPVTKAGAFSSTVVVPDDASPGNHSIIARGAPLKKNRNCVRPTANEASTRITVVDEEFRVYDRTIHLARRELDDPGIDETLLEEIASGDQSAHAIVQLNALPRAGDGDLDALREAGIELLDYLNGEEGDGVAYLASVRPDVARDGETFGELVRGVQRFLPLDKTSTTLDGRESAVPVFVLFFKDVGEAEATEVIRQAGLRGRPVGVGPSYETSASAAQIAELAADDRVQWIQEATDPMPTLDDARHATGVDEMQQFFVLDGDDATNVPGFGGLSGEGVQIAILDTSVDHTHQDFTGRVIREYPPTNPNDFHGTFVASIAAGSGYRSEANGGKPYEWRGMAPRAEIAAFPQAGWQPFIVDEAVNELGVDVLNNSYGSNTYGQYEGRAAWFDGLIHGGVFTVWDPDIDTFRTVTIAPRPQTVSVGNNGATEPRDCNGDGAWGTGDKDDGYFPFYPTPVGGQCPTAYHTGYFSILHGCKNCIGVTALAKEDGEPGAPAEVQPRPTNLVHLPLSGMGPTLDGRLKPDVAAPADFLVSAFPGNGYGWGGATSGASPVVSGIIALMLEQHGRSDVRDGIPAQPSTWKAILAQSAIDLVGVDPTPNFDTGKAVAYGPGPDFATGFGLVNAPAAIRIVRERGFRVGAVTPDDPSDDHQVEVSPGQRELKLTLAWDDLPASVSQSAAAKTVVNDLDLVLYGPNGEIHRPLVMPTLRPRDCDTTTPRSVQVGTCPGADDPAQNYYGPAKEGIDRRNNIEQIVVKDPAAGTWRARVSVYNPHRPALPGDSSVRLPLASRQVYSLATGAGAGADLRIEDSVEPSEVAAGQQYTMHLGVTNDGPDPALSSELTFTPSPGTEFGGNEEGLCDQATSGLVNCALGTIEVGETTSLTVHIQTERDMVYDSPEADTVSQLVRVRSLVPDLDPADNETAVALPLVARTDLEETLSFAADTATELAVGKATTVQLASVLQNHGPSAPVDATLALDAQATNGSVMPAAQSGLVKNVVLNEPTRVVHEVDVTCSAPGTTVVTVTATAQPVGPATDPVPSNDSSTATRTFTCSKKGKKQVTEL